MTDIVERLRKTADHEWIGHKTWTMAALREAADEIGRLRAQIDTLRELREFDRKEIERLKTSGAANDII